MNRTAFFAFAALLALTLGVRVHSQSVTGAKSVLQQLQSVKAANAALLEKQTAVLLKLEELQKDAAQTKFMVKRG
jgi:hypothetical protein